MPLAIPAELKKITSYVRRAEELDKDASNPESRLVAYYLRQYAVQQGIPLASTSAAAKTCLGHILESLEGEKTAMDNFTKPEAAFLCRQFAGKIFDKADAEDRGGGANKDTAKAFYAAASFLQILEQFYNVANDEEGGADEAAEDRKKILYAKWKATDILKALKEGREPTPGGYGEQEPELDDDEEQPPKDAPVVAPVKDDDADEEILLPPPVPQVPPSIPPPAPSSRPSSSIPPPVPPSSHSEPDEQGTEVDLNGNSLPPPPAYPGPSQPPPAATGRSRPPVNLPPPAPAPLPTPMPPPPAPARGGWFGGGRNNNNANKLTKAQWNDVVELTKFALAAMEDKDADLAAERLQQALQTLGR